ncbi:hypothetical protein [Deinococcus sonorensis]|uniref:Uncharacterized protein n=1 Tax=Deinococcus sonorensis TaxID=309891 RepID=A0ABV8YA32_9DEIO
MDTDLERSILGRIGVARTLTGREIPILYAELHVGASSNGVLMQFRLDGVQTLLAFGDVLCPDQVTRHDGQLIGDFVAYTRCDNALRGAELPNSDRCRETIRVTFPDLDGA